MICPSSPASLMILPSCWPGASSRPAPAAAVLDRPFHPYTHGLIGSVPSRNKRGEKLRQIPGMTPSLLGLPGGCAFRTRCFRADEICAQDPPEGELALGHTARCFHPLHLEPA